MTQQTAPGQPPEGKAANDADAKNYLRQYPENDDFRNQWEWPQVMIEEGVEPRP